MNNRMKKGFDLALKNLSVIYGALRKSNVSVFRNDYNDFVQEAIMAYAQCYCDYNLDHFKLEKFNNYAYQRLRWTIIDKLRKENRYEKNHILDNFEDREVVSLEKIDVLSLVEGIVLTDIEIIILIKHFIEEIPLKTLAEMTNFSQRYLRKVRKNLRNKLIGNSDI